MTEPVPAPERYAWLPPDEPEKITLPSGGWVQLRDPDTLREKHQKQVIRAIQKARDKAGDDGNETAWASVETAAALVIVAWDFPYRPDPIEQPDGTLVPRGWDTPAKDPSILEELRRVDYDALLDATKPHRTELFPPRPDPGDYADESSPTEPANE